MCGERLVNLGVLVCAVPARVEVGDASAEGGADGVTHLSVTLTDPVIHRIHLLHEVLVHLEQRGVCEHALCAARSV